MAVLSASTLWNISSSVMTFFGFFGAKFS